MNKTLQKIGIALAMIMGLALPVAAQTAITQTTLSAALVAPVVGTATTTSAFVQVASATNISVGVYLFVDGEEMLVVSQGATTTNLTVQRGTDGTKAGGHASGAVVYVGTNTSAGPGSPFVFDDPPYGTCTLTSEVFTVRINVTNGRVWQCANSVWLYGNSRSLSYPGTLNASSGTTVTLTSAQCGQAFAFDRAAGVIYVLPVPVPGCTFDFVWTVAQTSSTGKIVTAATTSTTLFMQGTPLVIGTTTMGFAGVPTTSVAVETNDTTTGGLIGGHLHLQAISATIWDVQGTLMGSGTVATPFTTTN